MTPAASDLVVVTQGAFRGRIGRITLSKSGDTHSVDIGGDAVLKQLDQVRPLTLGDVVVL